MSGQPSDPTAPDARLVVALAAALVLATVLAPVAYDAARATGAGATVAVVSLDGTITGGAADATVADLRELRRNESVDAVVLSVNSPGGGVAASERLYLAVARLAEEKTVVASAGTMAASGGYYAALPAERVYVLPSSVVGSVGAFATPSPPAPDRVVRSGPDKATTTTQQTRRQVEAIQESFLDTVFRHRGDRLELSRAELAHAKVYRGRRAVALGVADRVGTVEDAANYAAGEAGFERYELYRKQPDRRRPGVPVSADGERAAVDDPDRLGYAGVETTQYLMLHGRLAPAGSVRAAPNRTAGVAGGA